jgi:hypothetical protein
MNAAAEALKAARAAGVEVRLDGDGLVLEASDEPSAALLDRLAQHKAEILALLRSGREPICAVCHASGNLWLIDTGAGPVLVHEICARRLPKAESVPPSAVAYQAATAASGITCSVTIIELPAQRTYAKAFGALQMKPPALVEVDRWRQCVEDGKQFLARWGTQAESLGWSPRDLLGLITVPKRPKPSFNRLSRYDETGLCWRLQGRQVIALTESTASIRGHTGNITTYRRHNKPALGPLGDSLDDFT